MGETTHVVGSEIHQTDAVLFVVSAYSLSKGALKRLQAATAASTHLPTRLIRLEETGPSLIAALDELREEGYRNIRVQPFGTPFPESLLAWLPGVLADWQTRGQNADTALTVGPDPSRDARAITQQAVSLISDAMPPKPVSGIKPSLGKPGWNMPPDFEFHLLVCTGPRCAIHGAASFVHLLKEELAAAGISDRCLTTRTGCIYPCNKGPVLAVYPQGHWYRLPDLIATRRFVREVLVEGDSAEDLRFHTARAARAEIHTPKKEIVT
jgi:(2Fe-2S) ferredoxin